ncbi:MBL fold metallo-hydrolase [Archangium violaceum]|uniref:MBL fold metallo-hydrolase n=1 Tax=Archangium violaceum TaxID=83451 RepID=UPI0037BEF7D1
MMTLRTFLLRATLAVSLSAATGAVFAPSATHAAAPQVRTQAPGFYRMMLGDFEVTVISDGTLPLEPDKVLTNTRPEHVKKLLADAHLNLPVETSVNAFLINTGSKLVLVDTGTGEFLGPSLNKLVPNLRAAGYEPEQIDAVLLTHIHTDHSGGLTVGGKQIFPKALVYADKREVDFWLNADNMEKAPADKKPRFQEARIALDSYVAAGRLKTFEGDTELFPGIRSIASPGHTPGHSFYSVESKGQKLVLWGDVMHVAAVQFPEPSVTIQYDVDSKAAAAQRAKAYADAAKQGYWVGVAHVSFPGLGHVRANGKGYTWVPANYSISQ